VAFTAAELTKRRTLRLSGTGWQFGPWCLAAWKLAGTDSLPNLLAVDGDGGVEFKTQFDFAAADFEDNDLEHSLEAVQPSDHDRFLAFP
jgi:hypothetical protein